MIFTIVKGSDVEAEAEAAILEAEAGNWKQQTMVNCNFNDGSELVAWKALNNERKKIIHAFHLLW